ncbi:MAG TPA: ATP-binding protein [Candidatus Kapabacteria bacterium]|nr:ATP-binding protein [Candidatus Kapabacteria bacterium]
MEFFLTGEPGERGRFVEAFEEFCRRHHVPDAARQAADLALEEHLTNVLNYGFTLDEERWISVQLGVKNNALCVTVTDTGVPYDPLSAPSVDTSVPLEEKPIGGLGIYLMKKFMDQLTHEREGEKNVLTMVKGFGT